MNRVLRVVAIAVSVGALAGCSGGDKVVIPSATVQRVARTYVDTAPDRATIPDTTTPAVTTSAPVTVASVAASPIPTAPSENGAPVLNLLGVAEGALAAHDELARQQRLVPKQWDRSRLLEVMTVGYADLTLKDFASTVAKNRRYEAGTINERKVIRVESSPEGLDRAFAIICERNNEAEFDTGGTPEFSDDRLVQNEIGIFADAIPMKREGGRWVRDGLQDEDSRSCANSFS